MYQVLDECRNNWTNETDWDGIVTMDEIERLAYAWGVSVKSLMLEVKEI
jgi:hypothetical protein